jgi:16S rRNA (guanine966-N2)-methyltransferase
MRIIGGAFAGRRIDAPAGQSTRPTADRVREAVFNRLAHSSFCDDGIGDVFGSRVLDLYAGAGGLGLEALSRGAPYCDFIDSATSACTTIRRNLDALGLTARASIVQSKVDAFLRRGKERYGLVFADPPYDDAGAPLTRALSSLPELLLPGALVVVEHGDHAAPDQPQGLRLLDSRRYGQTVISFFASVGHDMGANR